MTQHTTANPFTSSIDEFERLAIEECIKRQRLDRAVSVLIISDYRCELAIKLAGFGAQVTVADAPECRSEVIGRALAAGFRDEIGFVPSTLEDMTDALTDGPFDLIVIRRGLCRLSHGEAGRLIRQLLQGMKIGGKLYLSLLGLHSELGEGYAAAEKPLAQRFAPLSPKLAEKYGIDYPVCLYSERDLFSMLLESGAGVLRTLTTTHGSVKAVAVRI